MTGRRSFSPHAGHSGRPAASHAVSTYAVHRAHRASHIVSASVPDTIASGGVGARYWTHGGVTTGTGTRTTTVRGGAHAVVQSSAVNVRAASRRDIDLSCRDVARRLSIGVVACGGLLQLGAVTIGRSRVHLGAESLGGGLGSSRGATMEPAADRAVADGKRGEGGGDEVAGHGAHAGRTRSAGHPPRAYASASA